MADLPDNVLSLLRATNNRLAEVLDDLKAQRERNERRDEIVSAQSRATQDIAAREHTTLYAIRAELTEIKSQMAVLVDNVKDAQRASEDAKAQTIATREATGRVQLAPPAADVSGPVKSIVRTVFKAPAARILAVAVLVFALVVGGAIAVAVYQEVRAIKARLGGEP